MSVDEKNEKEPIFLSVMFLVCIKPERIGIYFHKKTMHEDLILFDILFFGVLSQSIYWKKFKRI